MTYDPLNPVEFEHVLQTFRKEYITLYQQALKSGALPKLQEHDHTLAKCILIITASKFKPTTKKGKEMLQNLQHFI